LGSIVPQACVCEPLTIVIKRKIENSNEGGERTITRYVINCTRVNNPRILGEGD